MNCIATEQLGDAKDVMEPIRNVEGARFPVLTPNLKGFEAAVAAGAKEVAVFASASESFSESNINCSIRESLKRYHDVSLAAKKASLPIRGYISCVVGVQWKERYLQRKSHVWQKSFMIWVALKYLLEIRSVSVLLVILNLSALFLLLNFWNILIF
ncbi:hydroxymethylglutaryl-CoA lyase, mitochondrial-like [Syzygium oleosum]|uniref:hydroxymethylglutaryl-CoA lyase, mitochondrial-like n=1 Tax=Syzygium oleosum TaxID=219896 RepID=UPI0024B90EA2|nr:hydroxymethylglutaryl-CoA lyase, mitochondrial-like [Syzygium oleosum]